MTAFADIPHLDAEASTAIHSAELQQGDVPTRNDIRLGEDECLDPFELSSQYAYTPRKIRVFTIGAGFSGLIMAHKFQHRFPAMRNIVEHTIFEARDDVGGTWLANHYPGVQCDVPAHIYVSINRHMLLSAQQLTASGISIRSEPGLGEVLCQRSGYSGIYQAHCQEVEPGQRSSAQYAGCRCLVESRSGRMESNCRTRWYPTR